MKFNDLIKQINQVDIEIQETNETMEFTKDPTHLVFLNDHLENLLCQKNVLEIKVYKMKKEKP